MAFELSPEKTRWVIMKQQREGQVATLSPFHLILSKHPFRFHILWEVPLAARPMCAARVPWVFFYQSSDPTNTANDCYLSVSSTPTVMNSFRARTVFSVLLALKTGTDTQQAPSLFDKYSSSTCYLLPLY